MLRLLPLAFAAMLNAQDFEVASVKPATPQSGPRRSSMRGGPGSSDPERVIFTDVTLNAVLQRAYDAQPYQITGPDWLSSQRYDINAKVPPGTSKEQFGRMLQGLLTERFHLALHHETRELSGYALAAGKAQAKLKRSTETAPAIEPSEPPKTDANGFPQLAAPGLVMMEEVRGKAVVTLMTARAQPVSALVDRISREFRLPVVDETRLAGNFDFNLEFAPQRPGSLEPDTSADSAPNLLSAVSQQLGLRLIPKRIPVDVLVIDRADKVPIEN